MELLLDLIRMLLDGLLKLSCLQRFDVGVASVKTSSQSLRSSTATRTHNFGSLNNIVTSYKFPQSFRFPLLLLSMQLLQTLP